MHDVIIMEKFNQDCKQMKLNIWSCALAAGITWGIGVLYLAYAVWFFGIGRVLFESIASAYIGFDISFVGALIGFGWAFSDGFCGGLIFAVLYNTFSTKLFKQS